MRSKVGMFTVLCVGFIALIVTFYSGHDQSTVLAAGAAGLVSSTKLLSSDTPASKEYVLEVIGMGVTLDKYRQGALWEALSKGTAYAPIRDMDPKHHPWQGREKMDNSLGNEIASVENALLDTPRYWGVPAFNAEPLCLNEDDMDRPERPQGGVAIRDVIMRMPVIAHRELSERPDHIIEKIFTFFDQNPTVPYVILGSSDSTAVRADYSDPRQSLKDGWYVPLSPDASTVLVLARRERVDALRPFAFKDLEEPQTDVDELNRYGIARRVWLNYLELEKKVPTLPDKFSSSKNIRTPTSAEWLADLDIFFKHFNTAETSKIHFKLIEALKMIGKPTLSSRWKPKPWFPVPWNTEQLEQFDRLPTFGYLHRPVFVKMIDADGKPLRHESERQAALYAGWKAALETLPKAQRATGPARVIVATGGKTSQLLDFHGMLRAVAESGGPKFDPNIAKHFIDTDRRLGNTGAATFFMQTAIGVLGSYREGGVSAAFNLRDPAEASIIFVSPPSDEKRKDQQHPIGGDVLRSATVPAIDPRNYEEPSKQGD